MSHGLPGYLDGIVFNAVNKTDAPFDSKVTWRHCIDFIFCSALHSLNQQGSFSTDR